MKAGKPTLRVFLDEGVPASVGQVFREANHVVINHHDALPKGASDDVVCAAALANDAILVAQDADMKQLAQRYGITPTNNRFARLSIIRLCCNETLAAKRVKQAMTLIEHEWLVSEEKAARRLWVEISAHHIRTHR